MNSPYIICGGSWFNAAIILRCSYRGKNAPNEQYVNVSFRIILKERKKDE